MLIDREASAADALMLSWNAPEGCPSAAEVHDAAVRTAPPAVSPEPLEAQVRVDHGERWTVTIRSRRGGITAAERHLEADSCAALAEATAVILSLALMPESAAAPVPAPAPAPAPAPEPTTSLAAPEAGRSPSRSPFAHRLALSASVGTDATTLPSPALGGRATLAWSPSRVRIELGGAYFSGQSKTTSTSGAGATFAFVAAGARGCWAVARGAVELSPCAGADIVFIEAHGFGATHDYYASSVWLSAAAGALLRVPVTPWLAMRADGDGIVPASRPRFVVEGDGAVYRPGVLGVRGAIGAEVHFL